MCGGDGGCRSIVVLKWLRFFLAGASRRQKLSNLIVLSCPDIFVIKTPDPRNEERQQHSPDFVFEASAAVLPAEFQVVL